MSRPTPGLLGKLDEKDDGLQKICDHSYNDGVFSRRTRDAVSAKAQHGVVTRTKALAAAVTLSVRTVAIRLLRLAEFVLPFVIQACYAQQGRLQD